MIAKARATHAAPAHKSPAPPPRVAAKAPAPPTRRAAPGKPAPIAHKPQHRAPIAPRQGPTANPQPITPAQRATPATPPPVTRGPLVTLYPGGAGVALRNQYQRPGTAGPGTPPTPARPTQRPKTAVAHRRPAR